MDNDVKVYLTAVRANANMSQEEWAAELSVGKQTVLNWEKGNSKPDFETVKKMSELSGIPLQNICISRD